jgi:hypothetical protein
MKRIVFIAIMIIMLVNTVMAEPIENINHNLNEIVYTEPVQPEHVIEIESFIGVPNRSVLIDWAYITRAIVLIMLLNWFVVIVNMFLKAFLSGKQYIKM